jgi:hypothetical protein
VFRRWIYYQRAVSNIASEPPHRSAIRSTRADGHRVSSSRADQRHFSSCAHRKKAQMFAIGNMQLEELLDRVKTNRFNTYLIELVDAPTVPLKAVPVTPKKKAF